MLKTLEKLLEHIIWQTNTPAELVDVLKGLTWAGISFRGVCGERWGVFFVRFERDEEANA